MPNTKYYKQITSRSRRDFVKLLSSVERILKYERKVSRGLLKGKISEIRATKAFYSPPVIYLPNRGKAIFLGDIHGDSISVTSVLRQENFINHMKKGDEVYLVLLGDYADRGREDIKVLELVLQLKKNYPNNVFLIRGNHEEISMGQHFGLLGSCIRYFGYEHGQYVLEQVNHLFDRLPGLAVTASGIVAVHGGIPVSAIRSLHELDEEELHEMRWNDPTEEVGNFIFNYRRGSNYLFGQNLFNRFMEKIGGQVLIRSHEYTARGYKMMFDDRLLTIFSNGGKSPESGYRDFILQPKYAVVDLSKKIDKWSNKHIQNIKY